MTIAKGIARIYTEIQVKKNMDGFYWRRRLLISAPEDCDEFVQMIEEEALKELKDPDDAYEITQILLDDIIKNLGLNINSIPSISKY